MGENKKNIDGVTFERKISYTGSSYTVSLPLQLVNYMRLTAGDKINLTAIDDSGERMIIFWSGEL